MDYKQTLFQRNIMQNIFQPERQFSLFPPVIKNLLILNGLFFMATLVPLNTVWLMRWLALWPIGQEVGMVRYTMEYIGAGNHFWPWQLVTYGFLHGGFGHFFFNMFALWMFGVPIERVWGSHRFAIYYFACLVGAGAIQLAVTSLGGGFTVGASGAVFGLLLAFGMMYPEMPIYLYFFIPVKAKYFVIGYGLIELWAGFSRSGSNVAHFAHLGGMVIGLLLILYWRGRLPIKPRSRIYV